MARLPIPGSDDGTWGGILNDFLAVEHNTDGTLKTSGSLSTKANDSSVVHNTGDETVAGVKTFSSSPIVPTPSSGTQVANKTYVDSVASAGAPDATTTTKGIVQLAGDLSGTATSPTVPGLANKANSSVLINAGTGLTGGGNLTTDRTISANFGSTAGTIAQGNDSRITGAVQSTVVDAKGDLLVASAADTIVRLPVGSNNQVLTADSTQTSGVKWAAASGSSTSPMLTGMGLVGITADPLTFIGTASPNQADHLIVLIAVPSGSQITGAKVAIETAGTYSATGTPAQVRFWDFTGALLGTTPDDPAMWLTVGSRTATLATPFTAPSNGLLYVGISFGGFTGAATSVAAGSFNAGAALQGFLGGKRFNFYANSGAGMPSSFDPTTYGTGTTWAPLIGVTGS